LILTLHKYDLALVDVGDVCMQSGQLVSIYGDNFRVLLNNTSAPRCRFSRVTSGARVVDDGRVVCDVPFRAFVGPVFVDLIASDNDTLTTIATPTQKVVFTYLPGGMEGVWHN
jgi:hypothetical protein